MEKYLYFRTEATDTSAITVAHASCFPASSLMGMAHTSRTTVTLYFKNMRKGSGQEGAVDGVDSFENYDTVVLNVTTETQHTTIKAIAEAIGGPNFPPFIVVANDDAGGTEYLAGSTITSCGTITVAEGYLNS